MWLLIGLSGILSALAQALTLPLNNNALTLPAGNNAYSSDTYTTSDGGNTTTLLYQLPANLTSGGRPFPSGFTLQIEFGKSVLCTTAILVNFGNALADVAAASSKDHVRSTSWVVDSYSEVNIKLTVLDDKFARQLALMLLYHVPESMQKMKKWRSGRWTLLQGGIVLGRVEVNDGTTNRLSICDPPSGSMTTSKRSIVGDSSINITGTHDSSGNLTLTTIAGATSLGVNDSIMRLTCKWRGKSLGYLTALMSPLYIIAWEPLRDPDLYRIGSWDHRVTVESWDVTLQFLGYRPISPDWNYYWIIKALGQLPLAYADKTPYWDFREITCDVNLNSAPVGLVRIVKGIQF
ncbi:hypothetical protein ACLMJK_004587 [Lecanora helva]